jgi:hypothetical protein
MQRIDVATAVPTLPVPAELGTPGYFSEGDPLASLPATVVSGDFLNMVQEELLAPILSAGLAPSKTNRAQLLQAILVLILGANPVIGAAGSISLGGGLLVIKWGTTTIQPVAGPVNSQAATFPVAFPNACFGLVGNHTAKPNAGWNPADVSFPSASRSATGFVVIVDTTDPGQNITNAVPVFWIAIGN